MFHKEGKVIICSCAHHLQGSRVGGGFVHPHSHPSGCIPTRRLVIFGQNAELASAAFAEVELVFRSVSRETGDVKVNLIAFERRVFFSVLGFLE